MDVMKRVLSPQEIAAETNCSLQFIYKQLREGNIPHIRLGDKYLVSRNVFEAWITGEYPEQVGQKNRRYHNDNE